MKRQNEINAKHALLQILPQLTRTGYPHVEEPETTVRSEPEVDYLFIPESATDKALAIEHTVVEAYDGQVSYANKSFDVVRQVSDRCEGLVPNDRYYFIAIAEPDVVHLNQRSTNRFAEAAAARIVVEAPGLYIDDHMYLNIGGRRVLLMCRGSDHRLNGKVHRMPISPKDQTPRFVIRLWDAIQHAMTKFAKYRELHYGTVLALEDIAGAVALAPSKDELFYKQLANTLLTDHVGRLYDALLIQLEKSRVPIRSGETYTFGFGTRELINMVGLPMTEGNQAVGELLRNTKLKAMENRIFPADVDEIAKQASYYRKMQKIEKARREQRRTG